MLLRSRVVLRGLKTGIVGLPNVGKSTLFNALTGGETAQAANFPFCTIEPNSGIVEVHDKRMGELAKIHISQKVSVMCFTCVRHVLRPGRWGRNRVTKD